MSDRTPLDDEEQAILDEYVALFHAMQSGVPAKMGVDPTETTPKHLRVGVNVSMSDFDGLAKLLIDKGVISRKEYLTALRDSMRREVEGYQAAIEKHYGTKVTLA